MKRSILIGGLIAGAFLLPTLASAGVTGTCSTCHTMHDSQNANPMATGGPNDRLLKGDGCTACHTGGTNNASSGRDASQYGAPQVDDAANPTSGGYFNTISDQNLHNVTTGAVYAADANLGIVPPGAAGTRSVTLAGAGAFDCDSCHDGSGGHHGTAADYRMLSGVTGTGDANFGVTGRSANFYNSTMNDFCASCHGGFHAANQNGSVAGVWARHPTDISLSDYTGDSIVAAAETDAVVMGTDGATGTELVLCLSCHVPHGGAYSDLLSYDYSVVSAGNSTNNGGCEVCHSSANFDF